MGRRFMDRLPQRAALQNAWQRSDDEGVRVIVHGDPETGKSRLLSEFGRAAEAAGSAVISIRARRADASRPLSALTSIAYEVVTEEYDEESLGASRALLHAIAATREPDRDSEPIVAHVEALLASVARARRVVVVVDDADKADEASRVILERITVPRRCLIVFVGRSRLPLSNEATTIPLPAVTTEEIAIELGLALGEPDPAMAAEIATASAGLPGIAAALIELTRAQHHLQSWTERSEAYLSDLVARKGYASHEKVTSLVGRFSRHASPAPQDEHDAVPEQDRAEDPPPTFWTDDSMWVVSYAGARCVVPDTRGARCLAYLVENPNRSIHVYELPGAGGDARAGSAPQPRDGDPGTLLDSEATANYRQRIRDLTEEMEEAERFNDTHRAEKARVELEQLTQMLTSALGLGGRSRRHRWEAERARVAATKAIRSTIARLATMHERLGAHLSETVRTGFFCSYEPTQGATTRHAGESHDVDSVPFPGYTSSGGITP